MRADSSMSFGYPDEEVSQQEDRERQPERRVEEDQAEERVVQVERVVEVEDGDQRHLQRHDEQRDHEHEQPVALLVVPLQMALIPVFHLYNTFHLYDTLFGLILFHTALGLPFTSCCIRNFFIGIPKDILESATAWTAPSARCASSSS